MLRPGDAFDKYVIERLLGSGGMGEVYVVHHRRTKKRGALKIILPHLLTDPSMVERFLQEAQIGARIEDADHIVDVLDAGRDDAGSPWLVMEYLSGKDLAHVLEAAGTLPAEALVEILRQTAEALDRAHAKGVVHRDIKPENLFVVARPGKPNLVKVLDFGIAKILEQSTHTGTSAGGTIAYMAPEQGDSRTNIGPRADVWPIGLIAYRALVGQPYWLGDTAFAIMKELVADDLAKASERAAEQGSAVELSPEFDDFFARCVNRDPDARFATAGGAVTALALALGVTARVSLSIPEATLESDARSSSSGAPDSTPAPLSTGPTSAPTPAPSPGATGTDLELEVRVEEIKYAEQRRKTIALLLKLAAIPALVVAGVVFALWYDGHSTDRKRRDAWASFVACAVGDPTEAQHGLLALRRRAELQRTLDRLVSARDGAAAPTTELAKSDLLPCVPYAKALADVVERDDARRASFGKQIDAFARPADIPKARVTDALETAVQDAATLDLDGGRIDPAVRAPKLASVAVDASSAGTRTIPSTGADLVGTTLLRAGGLRRRTFRTPQGVVVCDFGRDGFECASYRGPKDLSLGSVVSAPPLGDKLLVSTNRGHVLLFPPDSDRSAIEYKDVWQASHAGSEPPRLLRGKPEEGDVKLVVDEPTGEVVATRLGTASYTQASVAIAWDKTILVGRPRTDAKAAPSGDESEPADPTPVQILEAVGTSPKLLGELEAPLGLSVGCRAGATTYVYLYDVSLDHHSALVTWRGDEPAALRLLPIGGYLDVTCDDAGLSLSGRFACPPEGACKETPSPERTIGWGGCVDGATEYAVEHADDAWILWKGPTGGALKASILLDVADVVAEPPSFACGGGFAYALLRNKTNTRVIDLTADPPRML